MITPVRTDPFIFRGAVNDAGYEWLKGIDGELRLVPRRGPGRRFYLHEPHPGVFRDFAALQPTQDAIKGFADTYGDILDRHKGEQFAVRGDSTVDFGTSLGRWRREIGDMRVIVSLWDQVQNRQLSELKKIITHSEKHLRYVVKTPKHEARVTLAHADIPESGWDRFDPEDVLLPARCALQMEINKRLSDTDTPSLVFPRLVWTPEYDQRIIFQPCNLLAAMWMQFAQAVTGKFQLKRCVVCGKGFQAGPGGKRADAITCSDSCRQRKKRESEPKKKAHKSLR